MDADLHVRLDRRSEDGRNGNFDASISHAAREGIDARSISFASDSHFVHGNDNASFRASRPDVQVLNQELSSSQSFRNAHGSLSPDANHPDGEGEDDDQKQGQKKVKAPRLYHKKSRNGCQRCKARRVKVCLSFFIDWLFMRLNIDVGPVPRCCNLTFFACTWVLLDSTYVRRTIQCFFNVFYFNCHTSI